MRILSLSKLMKIKHENRLYQKMLVLFVVVIIIPALILGVVAGNYSLNTLVEKSSSSYEVTIHNLSDTLETELFETKMIAYYMYLDLDLKEAIQLYDEDINKSNEITQLIKTKFENYKISANFNSVNVIKVYGYNGYDMSFGDKSDVDNLGDSKIISSQWYKEATINPDEFIWTGLNNSFTRIEEDKTISIFRVLKDRSYTQNVGMLYVNLDPQIYNSLADKFSYSETSEIFILDNNNETLSSEETPDSILKLVNQYNKDFEENYNEVIDLGHEKYFINYIIDYNWKVIGVLPVKEITKSVTEVFKGIALLFIGFLGIASIIWLLVLAKIFGPIKELTKATKAVREGDLTIQVTHKSLDEIGVLTNNFNYMVQKINRLMEEVVEENSKIKDAEYKALQAQINPHFLYNTLNSIRWMSIIQKADNIKNVVDVLGRLLRNNTSKMDQFISIEEEISNLKDYIYIQKIAYNNKFDVIYDIDQRVLTMKCLKFILQPLVENAIFHGILPKSSYGTIWVSIMIKDGILVFIVKDDGVGMSQDEINSMLSKDNDRSKKFNGIGIHSVKERILITWNQQAKFEVDSMVNEFTVIIIEIPLLSEEGLDVKSNDR